MALSSNYDTNGGQEDDSQVRKQFRLELSLKQVILYGLGLVLAMSWMFVFGVLVGRGVPLVSSKDISPKAHLYRFLGLGRETAPPPEDVAKTWEDPKKMMEALNYYEDLTQKGSGPSVAPHVLPTPPPAPLRPEVEAASAAVMAQKKASEEQKKAAEEAAAEAKKKAAEEAAAALAQKKAAEEAAAASQKKPSEDPASQKQKQAQTAAPPAPVQPAASGAQKSVAKKPQPESAIPADVPIEHFTLLIASLKDSESAQRLVEQLRAKGHAARLEALDLNDSGRWNRVLVGAFRSREEALRFAAEFNRKERMEALVIREAR